VKAHWTARWVVEKIGRPRENLTTLGCVEVASPILVAGTITSDRHQLIALKL
jgi:hypothetical protein